MSRAHTTDVGTERKTTSGTDEALSTFVGQSVVEFRYFLLALILAVVWWKTIGAFSAFAAGLGLVMLSSGVQNGLRALLSRRWPTTEGVVAESKVLSPSEAREHLDDATTADEHGFQAPSGYVPFVRYEFTVDGTRYDNARISPFDGPISRRTWAEALVGDHPRGKPIRVRYDPDDPTRSYLRDWVRSSSLVFSSIGVVFLALAVWFAAGFPGGAPVAAIGVGLPAIVFGLRRAVLGRRSRRWPTTSGVVTSTDVSRSGGGDDSEVTYVPELRYEYEVEQASYVGSRYGFGKQQTFDRRSAAHSWIGEHYPEDAEVTVHYDPDRPDRSVLVPGAGSWLVTLVVGLAFTGLGMFLLLTGSGGVL